MSTVLETVGLTKRFGGVVAADQVNLQVSAGEIRAIIGPNGAGKSTFFNMVCGELRPDGGQILLEGRDLTGMPPHAIARLGVRRTMQITHILPRLTVLDNVVVAVLARRGLERNVIADARRLARKRAEELLQAVGLVDQMAKVAGTMAHGDQKRLELAMALAGEPRLLLLDEPTAGLSRPDRMEMVRLISDVARSHGLTVVFTEHDMDAVFSISDRITVLYQGRIIAEGSPSDVRSDPEVRRIYLGTQA